jgi:prepilin-type N-terminal cleavage/methylation domain-containing protein
MRQPRSYPAAGFTLLEMLIAAALLGIMVMAVSTLSVSGMQAQEYARRLTRATEITQDVVDGMRIELTSSVRLFGNDTEGNANLAVLDLVGAPARLAGSRLPTPDANGSVRQDTVASQITGNSLLFARLAWNDRFVGPATGREYMIDVYRWVYYYLTPEDGGPQAGRSIGLNLVRVVGEPLADASAIDAIANAVDRAALLQHLRAGSPDALGVRHSPCQVVWRRGGLPAVAGTLREINPADGSLSNTPLVATGRPSPWRVLRTEVAPRGLLSYRHHSVATVHAPINQRVSRFGVRSTTGTGFPHGFEVQTVGPSSARQVLLHLAIASTNRSGHTAFADVQMMVDARDQ